MAGRPRPRSCAAPELAADDTAWAMAEIMAGDATPGPARRLRRAAARQGRDAGRAGRPGADDARPRAAGDDRGPGRRRRRHRRRPRAHRQHLDDGRARRRRVGAPGRQARQPGGVLGLRDRRRARGARRRDRPAAGRRGAHRRRGRHRVLLRAGVPRRHAARRAAARASWASPTVFNFLGPLTNPARVTAARGRLRRPADGAAHGRGARRARRHRARVPRRRRAGRADDDDHVERLGRGRRRR